MKHTDSVFSVVGVGASAGGLAAISELLGSLPDTQKLAVVVLQHLAPDHESILPELLRKTTPLRVVEVTDGMPLDAGFVYVLPPGRELKVLDGALHLTARVKGQSHPVIDLFFRSLAEQYKEHAIGVVLSGSGSDGALGLCAIKAAGGFTFAQEPRTAQFDAMPLAAIGSGCIDRIATSREIAAQLITIADSLSELETRIGDRLDSTHGELEAQLKEVFGLLKKHRGNDFSQYKRSSVIRRLERRMMLTHVDNLYDYVSYLKQNSEELGELFRDLLINVTRFFRDPEAFDALKSVVFTPLIESLPPGKNIRVWVPACSTGEEVYSVAMSLVEALGEGASSAAIQIFGTDVDVDAIEQARKGCYHESMLSEVSPQRLQSFFTKKGEFYTVRKSLRELCIFAPQNVLADPPFSHIDVLCCRNLLIYLNRELQARVLQLFHYSLRPNGVLFLGSSETTGPASDLFALIDKKNKIYRKKQSSIPRHYEFSTTRAKTITTDLISTDSSLPQAMQRQPYSDLEQLILTQFAPPGVVVNENLDIVFFLGHAGRYLDPVAGSASLNLMKLARREIVGDLRILVDSAIRHHQMAQRSHVQLDENGHPHFCTIEVQPLLDNHRGRFFAVVFREEIQVVTTTRKRKAKEKEATPEQLRIRELENELQETKRYLQGVTEEHAATNEELQAASEEIQSTNEELQSTNEELETAREELQSTNEELATVNEELETRNSELMQTITDLNNLLVSVNVPIIMLDEHLAIRKFTPPAGVLFNLIDADVGRPLTVIKPNLELPELAPLVANVLDTLVPKVVEVSDKHGRCYELKVMPYRTEDRRITGCVLILMDITDLKLSSERAQRLATVVSDSRYVIIVYNLKGKIQTWNPQASQIYGYSEEEMLGNGIDLLVPAGLHDEMRNVSEKLLRGENVAPLRTQRLIKSGELLDMLISPSLLRTESGEPYAIVNTERKLEQSELK